MPQIEPDTPVTMAAPIIAGLMYPPPGGSLIVAVEDAALKAKTNRLTTVVACDHQNEVTWVGSVDEGMLATGNAVAVTNGRQALTGRLLVGAHIWEVIRPGALRPAGSSVQDTVYQCDRPWIVIGELKSGSLIAVPLNDIGAGVRGHYQCKVKAEHLLFTGSKDSMMELNHIWSFPMSAAVGTVDQSAWQGITAAVQGYFPGKCR